MLPCSPPAALSTCSYAAATAASCCSLVGPTAVGTKSPLGLGGLLPSGARSPMAVGSVHHCRCLPWIGAWTGKGLEGGPAAGPAACRPAASLLPILGEPAQSWSNLRDSQSVARMADPPTAPARDPQQAPAPPQLSPLSGAYLLIVVGEPFSEEHKKLILQKLQQGKRGSLCERGVLSTQSREVFRLQIGSVQGKTCRVQRGGI